MIGAGLVFDWTYNDLDQDFREKFRRKLIYHARAMYHGGHLNKNKATGYWQNETHNNHRWHRDAGWACALLAAYDGRKEDGWILQKLHDELALVARWMPDDGTTHESSSYLIFGAAHLTLAMQAGDRCFGTRYLQRPFTDQWQWQAPPARFAPSGLPGQREGGFRVALSAKDTPAVAPPADP